MMIIGVDYHPSFQQIAFLDQETGECGERRLSHDGGEADRFYRELQQRGICVRVGLEATGYARWLERLLAELGFEVWIGDFCVLAVGILLFDALGRNTSGRFLASCSAAAVSSWMAGFNRSSNSNNSRRRRSCGANRDEESWKSSR